MPLGTLASQHSQQLAVAVEILTYAPMRIENLVNLDFDRHLRWQYDCDGQLLTATFMDYTMPRASDFPRVDALVLEDEPAPNPLGVKGIGEGGTSGAGAAIANAVANALRPLGVAVNDLPMTPERVWKAIQSAESKSQDNSD